MKVCFRFALYLVNFRRRCYRLRRTPKILPKLKFKPRCLCFMANIADAALCYIRRVLFQTGCVYSANLFFTFTSLHLKTDQNVAHTRNCSHIARFHFQDILISILLCLFNFFAARVAIYFSFNSQYILINDLDRGRQCRVRFDTSY
jgi:hypothetical protein